MKKVVYLAPDASSKVFSRVLSVLFATTTHLSVQGIFWENIEQAFKVSRGRIALWIENKMNGKEFGGKGHKTKLELEVHTYVFNSSGYLSTQVILYTIYTVLFVSTLMQLWVELFKFKCGDEEIHAKLHDIMQEHCQRRMKRVSVICTSSLVTTNILYIYIVVKRHLEVNQPQ